MDDLDRWWDSESRRSPFSTVCDPEEEWCEEHDQDANTCPCNDE